MKLDRVLAGGIAAVAWTGLGLQFQASMAQLDNNVAATLWVILRYFTVITNLLVAIVFTAFAFGRTRIASPFILGGVTLAILLVGVVYMTLLRGMIELSGGALLADTLNHKVTPVLCGLYWLLVAKKGKLDWNDPMKWALLPLAYFIYGIWRGKTEGKYAYPFINLDKLGWPQVLINAAVIAAGFIAVGYIMVWLDRRMSGRR